MSVQAERTYFKRFLTDGDGKAIAEFVARYSKASKPFSTSANNEGPAAPCEPMITSNLACQAPSQDDEDTGEQVHSGLSSISKEGKAKGTTDEPELQHLTSALLDGGNEGEQCGGAEQQQLVVQEQEEQGGGEEQPERPVKGERPHHCYQWH